MIEIIIIPVTAILNRFRGGGIISKNIPARLWISGLILASFIGSYVLAGYGVKLAIYAFFISLLGFALTDITGTGVGFGAIHGRYDGVRKYSLLNRWMYFIADKTGATGKCWGFWYMTCRGLYGIPLLSGLAALLNPILIPIGLLSLLQGGCYRLVGCFPENRFSVAIAEILYGAVLGIAIFITSVCTGK